MPTASAKVSLRTFYLTCSKTSREMGGSSEMTGALSELEVETGGVTGLVDCR